MRCFRLRIITGKLLAFDENLENYLRLSFTIDMSDMISGTYILEMITEDGQRIVEKLIKLK